MLFQGESFATRTKAVDYKDKDEDDDEVAEKKKSKHKKHE
jgi:hypothetical protein